MARILQDGVLSFPSSDGSIVLSEPEASMEVAISSSPRSLVAVHVGTLGHLGHLKDGEWNKRCDYLLVAESDGKAQVCLVELKTTLTNEQLPREQLLRSKPILDYLRSACEIEHGIRRWPSGLTVKYNLIATKRSKKLDKQKVRPSLSDEPERESYKNIKVQKFVGERIPFSKLV